jgi:pimeloyl-ACP methyl ester carboxylesterase
MVIHGEADPQDPLAAGVGTAEHIAGAQLLVLEGMGHALPMRLWPRIIEGIVRVAG